MTLELCRRRMAIKQCKAARIGTMKGAVEVSSVANNPGVELGDVRLLRRYQAAVISTLSIPVFLPGTPVGFLDRFLIRRRQALTWTLLP